MTTHETYIARCLKIAKNGLGSTRPNPMVGAVIVYNNKIIGEGFTSPYGGHHAEVNAINSVKNKAFLSKSTLYVTLEPCSHFGKTPPCSDLIVTHKIPEVVIGCIDDNPKVAGKGIAKLKGSGCKVTLGVLEAECKDHHKRFFSFHSKKRPYIILKWAETKDGFIAPMYKDEKRPVWITNIYSRQLAHKWRAEEHAILVGTNTVFEDNPSLTIRDWSGEQPIRVVLDRDLNLDRSYSVFNDAAKTIVITEKSNDKMTDLSSRNFEFINWSSKETIAKQICEMLYKRYINSIIIEGGSKTLQTFIDEGLWDEARVFTGSVVFKVGIKSPQLDAQLITEHKILDDKLKVLRPHRV